MSSQPDENVHPDALRQKATGFETDVVRPLDQATTTLKGDASDVAFPAFSTIGYALAAAYVETLNFTFADLDTKMSTCFEFAQRLRTTADSWHTAEDASTVRTDG